MGVLVKVIWIVCASMIVGIIGTYGSQALWKPKYFDEKTWATLDKRDVIKLAPDLFY